MNMFTHWEKNPSRLKSIKLFSVKLSFDQLNKHDSCNNKQHIVFNSVSDPDPVGSVSFGRIRIRIRIRKR